MTIWISLIGAFIVWSAHFAGLYLVAEFAPDTLKFAAPILFSLGLTANGWLFWRTSGANPWIASVARGGAIVSSIAIIWQTLPVYL